KPLENLRLLRRLYISNTQIDDAAFVAISRFSKVQFLDASGTPATTKGIAALKAMTLLEDLELADCPNLTDEVVPVLKEFRALKRIDLRGAKLSLSAVEDLRKVGILVEFGGKATKP